MHMDKELQELAFALMDKAAEKNLAKIAIQNGDFSITIETHAPAIQTVAVAAPAAPILGIPNRPKIRIGSRIRLTIAPAPCVSMA